MCPRGEDDGGPALFELDGPARSGLHVRDLRTSRPANRLISDALIARVVAPSRTARQITRCSPCPPGTVGLLPEDASRMDSWSLPAKSRRRPRVAAEDDQGQQDRCRLRRSAIAISFRRRVPRPRAASTTRAVGRSRPQFERRAEGDVLAHRMPYEQYFRGRARWPAPRFRPSRSPRPRSAGRGQKRRAPLRALAAEHRAQALQRQPALWRMVTTSLAHAARQASASACTGENSSRPSQSRTCSTLPSALAGRVPPSHAARAKRTLGPLGHHRAMRSSSGGWC